MEPRLGVNIDHIATLRQLRGTPYPDLLEAAQICIAAGAEQITVHLREDRRHIQDADVVALRKKISVPLNLELALAPAILKFATRVKPDWACLVPEKRQEVTTEGGLDVRKHRTKIAKAIEQLARAGIRISLFVEPDAALMKLCKEIGAHAVELHTGRYCQAAQGGFGAKSEGIRKKELARIEKAGRAARECGLHVNAGHGLDYENVRDVVVLRDERGAELFEEYNIGHVIVCRAALVGLERAVREMVSAIRAP